MRFLILKWNAIDSYSIHTRESAWQYSTRVDDNAWTFKCRMWLVVGPVVSTFLSRFLLTMVQARCAFAWNTRFSAFYLFLYVLLITSSPVVVVVVVVAPSSQSSSSYIVVVCLCCLFWLCVSLCCQSFSGSVTVTMAGSTQTAQTGNTGHATVNTNSQTHTSSEQQLPVPTPLHYPCKICGK